MAARDETKRGRTPEETRRAARAFQAWRERGAPSGLDPAARPSTQGAAGVGLARRLLDALVAGFARGACMHHAHPDYLDAPRDLRRSGGAPRGRRWRSERRRVAER